MTVIPSAAPAKTLALSALIAIALSGAPALAAQNALELSDYRYFVLYPHFEKALSAQKKNDEKVALREFTYLHRKAPDNIPLTLYLAEAQRRFGHDEQARAVLSAQLKRFPGDARLRRALEAIPGDVLPVDNRAELIAELQRCNLAPTLHCRNEVSQNALRLNEPGLAAEQLKDARFAASAAGKKLRRAIIDRAIGLRAWSLADAQYARLAQQQTLTDAEQEQWFNVLIAGRLDDQLEWRQARGVLDRVEMRLRYAGELAQRGERQRLARYLAQTPPTFTRADQEKGWLYLLSRYSADPATALARFRPRFAVNRRSLAEIELPTLLREQRWAEAKQRLADLPADKWPEARFAVSVALRETAAAVKLARQLAARAPRDLSLLDQLSYQLIGLGQPQAAAQLLLNAWPWPGHDARAMLLLQRLTGLAQAHPQWFTPAQRARLLRPLPTAEQRNLQVTLLRPEQCDALLKLAGDFSPRYDADTWMRLGNCLKTTQPGLALYAYQQSELRQPDKQTHGAVAYQAWAVQDYRTATRAWAAIAPAELDETNLLAAAASAQAAGDGAARDRWLDELARRGKTHSEAYWWLRAQRWLKSDPTRALADLDRALAVQPSARVLLARAAIVRQRGDQQANLAALQAAARLEPNNAEVQAALGYALWDAGQWRASRDWLEKAYRAMPDNPDLPKQLTYVNQRLNDVRQTRYYAERVIDNYDETALVRPLQADERQTRFNFRRLHEDSGRRWTLLVDTALGLRSGTMSAAQPFADGQPAGQTYRSYSQASLEYRLGRGVLRDGDELALYGRVYAGSADDGVFLPVKDPMLGLGVRWKPLREQIFYLALEQQFPLSGQGEADTMLRASASFLNGGTTSDEWHPNGPGWLAQNLYLDAAWYLRQHQQAYTGDYRLSWHQKVARSQTLEPYAHAQVASWRDDTLRTTLLAGVGTRWNLWFGETRYDAWPHKTSVGLEYQRTLHTINQQAGERNNFFLNLEVRW